MRSVRIIDDTDVRCNCPNIRPLRQGLIVLRSVRRGDERTPVAVRDGNVQHSGRILDDGVQLVVQVGVVAQRFGHGLAHRSRVLRIELAGRSGPYRAARLT